LIKQATNTKAHNLQ